MYFNDVHIYWYVFAIILGLLMGQFVDWMIKRLPDYKKVFSKEIFKEYKRDYKLNYLMMLINAILYVVILYIFGIKDTFIANLDLIKYYILTPILLSIFVIDYKHQIIPNRLTLTMFEIGLVFAFIYGLSNIAISINMILGMVAGAGIFLLITLLGGLVYGKEAMGFGDVKLMGCLGLWFGFSEIIIIALMSFLIGAILSILLLVTRVKKSDEYIPFGPFIVLSTFIAMFVPYNTILVILMKVFTLGLYKG